MKKFKDWLYLLPLTALSIWSVRHMLLSGFFPIHDNTQVQRVFEMSKSLSDGMFPVRWVADLGYGYGYPIFNFYAPLAYYVGAFFQLSGFDPLVATKLMMSMGMILSGFTMYLLGRSLWGVWGGLISALFYVYAPYHALNAYVRGDVAEFWAYAFIPIVFYSLLKVYRENNLRYIAVGSVSYALLILSHNLTAFLITPFLVLFAAVFLPKGKKFISYFFITVIMGLGLSAFYILPAILESKYTNVLSIVGGGADFRDHFVCIPQLWESAWGFGGSASGCIDGMSFRMGKLHILVSAVALLLFCLGMYRPLGLKKYLSNQQDVFRFMTFSIVGFLVSLLLMIEVSKPVWEIVPFMEFLQYPWRYLAFSSFFSSVLVGFVVWMSRSYLVEKKKKVISLLVPLSLAIFVVVINAKLFIPQVNLRLDSDSFTNREALTWSTSRISDEYMPKGFMRPESSLNLFNERITSMDIEVLNYEEETGKFQWTIEASQKTEVNINVAFFPAWTLFVDDTKVNLKENESGMRATIPKGRHSLSLVFTQTPVEKISNLISLTFVFILIAGIIYTSNKKYE